MAWQLGQVACDARGAESVDALGKRILPPHLHLADLPANSGLKA